MFDLRLRSILYIFFFYFKSFWLMFRHWGWKPQSGLCELHKTVFEDGFILDAALLMWDLLLPCRQEGHRACPGPSAGQPHQTSTHVADPRQQLKDSGWLAQGEEGRLCIKQEEFGRGAGEAVHTESDTPAGSEAVQEAWADLETAERRTDSGRQRHAGLSTDGGNFLSF